MPTVPNMGSQLVITTLLVAVASAAVASTALDNGRIVNGYDVDISQVPYQVAVLKGNNLCGGSILSANYVVTAAHCTNKTTEPISVRAGSNYHGKEGIVAKVLNYTEHDKYIPGEKDYDIAILRVESLPINATKNILPVTLPVSGHIWGDSVMVSVFGWGRTENGNLSQTLKGADLLTLNTILCSSVYETVFTERMLCVGDKEWIKDSCNGDSGGPLVLNNNNPNHLIGIVSYGPAKCALPNYPGVYTSVAHPEIRGFINSITGL